MEWNILTGDAIEHLRTLPDQSVQTCVTSPPYWGLRSYLPDDDPAKVNELGAEQTPDEYVANMVAVFREVWRVLRDDGTLWLNLGDSYTSTTKGSGGPSEKQVSNAGSFYKMTQRLIPDTKPKDLVGIPWRVAFALQADGWYLRSDIIWAKTNPMPESATDRPTKAHEYLFLLTKSARYYYDAEAIKEPSTGQTGAAANFQRETKETGVPGQGYLQHRNGRTPTEDNGTRNKRSVWTVSTKPYSGSHYAAFPPDLIEPCILAGTSAKGQCPECGAPWERVVERGAPNGLTWQDRKEMGEPMRKGYAQNRGDRTGGNTLSSTNNITLGWKPTCDCRSGPIAAPVPQTVLDPFVGSGTTLQVAIKHNRNAIGIDLDARNVALINERMSAIQPVLFS